MLQILQTRHLENYADLIDKLGLADEAVSVVEATEGDEIIGIGVYHMDFMTSQVVIDHAQYGDLMLGDGIYRSILFLAMLRSIDKARLDMKDEKLIGDCVKLGFVTAGSSAIESISSILDGCKDCKENT